MLRLRDISLPLPAQPKEVEQRHLAGSGRLTRNQTSSVYAGSGDQRTHPFAMKGNRRTRPVDGMEDQRTNSVTSWGDQRILPDADSRNQRTSNWEAERKTKCELCGEILPAGPDFLRIHNDMYHFQEVIELD